MKVSKKRNQGLDLVRAIAILLVLIGHFELVSDTANNYSFYKMGFYGVELFFVLSGFLIGQIILKNFYSGLTLPKIRTFWYRRWLRTIPLYFLILIIRELFFNPESSFHYLHYVFLQTIVKPVGYDSFWFGETWSLVVEEWFYLLLPFLLLLIAKVRSNIKSITLIFLGIFILFIVMRYLYVTQLDPSPDYNKELRCFAPLRLDSILFGVLLAFIKTRLNTLYIKLSKVVPFIIILISFCVLNLIPNVLVYNFEGIKTVSASIGFSLISLHFVLLLPFLEQSDRLNSFLRTKGVFNFVTYTSVLSYCIYLIHTPIYELLVTHPSYFSLYWWLQVMLSIGIIYTFAYLSYRYFEIPILRWRDKITK